MTQPTCNVLCAVFDDTGAPVAGATITAKLNQFDVYDGYLVPQPVVGTTDSTGQCTIALWPNQLGSTQSMYSVKIQSTNGKSLLVNATVPNVSSANLWEIAELPPYPGLTDGQLILTDAVAAGSVAIAKAAEAATSASTATTQAGIATTEAGIATTQAGIATTEAGIATTQAGAAASSAAASSASATAVLSDAGFIAVHGALSTIATLAADLTNINAVAADLTALNSIAGDLTALNAVAADLTAINTVNSDLTNINTVAGDHASIVTVAGDHSAIVTVAGDHAAISTVAADHSALVLVAADLANINSDAGDLSNINLVATNIANVNSVAGDLTNINAVVADKTNIDAVAADLTNINTVAGDHTAMTTIVADKANIDAVAGDLTNINSVAADLANINTVAGDHSALVTIVADKSNIDAVAADLTNVNLVAGSISQVDSVAADLTALNALYADKTALDNVAADLTNINSVAADLTNINNVAADLTNINSVATGLTNVNAVAGDLTNINLVAGDKTNIDAVAGALTAINAAGTNATNAAASATTATTEAGLASGSAVVAASQASLAAGYAASAGSAIQQDISGVTAAALHRSPNAVVAMFVNDTTKDSDGGAWTERCQHTSWYNEALNGKWLGACVSATSVAACETIARAISGAATGDYFQASYDGNFYSLNKNLLLNTATLGTQSKTLAAGTYTLSSTTGSSGSVAVSGAATASHTAGGAATTFTVATAGSVTFTVTGSVLTAQCETGSSATAYSANTGFAYTVVYRGNKAKFPKLAAIVAEAGNVTIYDLTEPGRPMWMRFACGAAQAAFMTWYNTNQAYCTVAALNGVMVIGSTGSNSGLAISFPKDDARIITNGSGYAMTKRNISYRQSANLYVSAGGDSYSFASATINAVAMTVLPDAPVDPVSGLQVPTIAVATNIGYGIIKHDGSIVTTSNTSSFNSISISKEILVAGRVNDATLYYVMNPASQVTGFTCLQHASNTATDFNFIAGFPQIQGKRSEYMKGNSWSMSAMVQRLKNNEAAIGKGMSASMTRWYNTGWQIGDIRRSYLVSSWVETIAPTDYLTGDSSTFASSQGSWVNYSAYTVTYDSVNHRLTVANNVGQYYGYAKLNIGSLGLTVGKEYVAILGIVSSTTGSPGYSLPTVGMDSSDSDNYATAGWSGAGAQNVYLKFTYQGGGEPQLRLGTGGLGASTTYGSILIRPAVIDRSYKNSCALIYGSLTKTLASPSANNQLVMYSGFSASNYIQEPVYSADLDFGTGEWSVSAWVNIPTGNAAAATIIERNYSSGAYITLGITSANYFVGTAYDGTTTRTVTTSAAYNTNTEVKVELIYRLDGSLSIMVNGVQVAVTYGNPLLTLNNSNAVLTIGNNYALNAPFPGSIALLKLSATAPTPDQSAWMYEQEKHLFRDGANCLLPDSGSIVDLTYDEVTDKWVAVSATNESDWTGLVRTGVIAVPAGSNIKAAAGSGIKLNARSTTGPGVDVTIPAWNLREELVKRAEAAAKKAQPVVVFDYSGGFTATTVNGNTAITSVASLTYPAQGSLYGATVTGTGIPASTVIVAISGTTIYLSKACTAGNSAVQIALSDFILPVGYETRAVLAAGALKKEGATSDWTRTFDGFREKVTFGTAPGYSAFVEIQAVRSITQ